MTLSQYANMFSAKRTYHGCTSSLSKPTLYRSGEQTAVQLHVKTRKESVKPDLSTFQKPVAKVEKLWVYPVKSCKGVELSTAHRGLKHDRYEMNME